MRTVEILCPTCLEDDLEVEVSPAEEPVPYYPDGTGYPGCPASCEVIYQGCRCPLDYDRVLEAAEDAALAEEHYELGADDAALEAAWEAHREEYA